MKFGIADRHGFYFKRHRLFIKRRSKCYLLSSQAAYRVESCNLAKMKVFLAVWLKTVFPGFLYVGLEWGERCRWLRQLRRFDPALWS